MCAGSVWGERQGVCGRVGLRGKAGRRTHVEDKGECAECHCVSRACWVVGAAALHFCLLRLHIVRAFLCVGEKPRAARRVACVLARGRVRGVIARNMC